MAATRGTVLGLVTLALVARVGADDGAGGRTLTVNPLGLFVHYASVVHPAGSLYSRRRMKHNPGASARVPWLEPAADLVYRARHVSNQGERSCEGDVCLAPALGRPQAPRTKSDLYDQR